MTVTPTNQIMRRMSEHGRIRYGMKGTKGEPRSLRWFRFTTADQTAIEQLAHQYGGEPKPWRDRGEWELVSKANEIEVILPPDPLGSTPVYELWTQGGLVRRCDGDSAVVVQAGAVEPESVAVPCLCHRDGLLACKPTTRLTVILPTINFGGGWRLEAKGWNVAQEMPGMVEVIQSLQTRSPLTRAILALEAREMKRAGKTKKFMVPVLRLGVSTDQLALGAATGKVEAVAALQPGQ